MKEEHAEQAIEELKKWGDTSKVHWVQCNLEDLKQVDEVAKKLKSEEKQIDAVRPTPDDTRAFSITTNTAARHSSSATPASASESTTKPKTASVRSLAPPLPLLRLPKPNENPPLTTHQTPTCKSTSSPNST